MYMRAYFSFFFFISLSANAISLFDFVDAISGMKTDDFRDLWTNGFPIISACTC